MATELQHLLQKYNVALPRYTSYPPVPNWNTKGFSVEMWEHHVVNAFETEKGEVCLYIHLPFCEELCTYCACNKRITKNHAVEQPYLDAVLTEWTKYLLLFGKKPVIKEIHLGGGTPTFFAPEALKKLIQDIVNTANVSEDKEFSVEVHPNYTTTEHLKALRHVGFNRISLGVQDFDPNVQYIINRIQTFEQTKQIVDKARNLGFESINIDLVYGLPLQTSNSVKHTIKLLQQLMPDRIAFYSYAHVPWKSKAQRRYSDEDVPGAMLKMEMYETGSRLLRQIGYHSIGMDHFALPDDKLMIAYSNGNLHRNFMGYTTTNHKLVIGLGASSISDTWDAFAQNEKEVEAYQQKIMANEWAITNGHLLSTIDKQIRNYILDLMCRGFVKINPDDFSDEELKAVFDAWKSFEADGLLVTYLNNYTAKVTEKGRLFIRNISAVLDRYLVQNKTDINRFSKAI